MESSYTTIRKLGEGTFGIVNLVRRKKDGRLFAAKSISIESQCAMTNLDPRSEANRYQARQKILDEVRILSHLPQHPCIVGLEEVIETRETIHLILEYVGGGTLAERVYPDGGEYVSSDDDDEDDNIGANDSHELNGGNNDKHSTSNVLWDGMNASSANNEEEQEQMIKNYQAAMLLAAGRGAEGNDFDANNYNAYDLDEYDEESFKKKKQDLRAMFFGNDSIASLNASAAEVGKNTNNNKSVGGLTSPAVVASASTTSPFQNKIKHNKHHEKTPKAYFPLPPEEIVRSWLNQLANALTFLHQHNVIHRDLKLQNVLCVNPVSFTGASSPTTVQNKITSPPSLTINNFNGTSPSRFADSTTTSSSSAATIVKIADFGIAKGFVDSITEQNDRAKKRQRLAKLKQKSADNQKNNQLEVEADYGENDGDEGAEDGSGGGGEPPAGTAMYMSPEILSSESYDSRIDVWALGVMTFELICGRPPWRGRNILALTNRILNDDLPPIERRDAVSGGEKISDDLKQIVRLMLEKDPQKRPFMSEVAQMTRKLITGNSSSPSPTTTNGRKQSPQPTVPSEDEQRRTAFEESRKQAIANRERLTQQQHQLEHGNEILVKTPPTSAQRQNRTKTVENENDPQDSSFMVLKLTQRQKEQIDQKGKTETTTTTAAVISDEERKRLFWENRREAEENRRRLTNGGANREEEKIIQKQEDEFQKAIQNFDVENKHLLQPHQTTQPPRPTTDESENQPHLFSSTNNNNNNKTSSSTMGSLIIDDNYFQAAHEAQMKQNAEKLKGLFFDDQPQHQQDEDVDENNNKNDLIENPLRNNPSSDNSKNNTTSNKNPLAGSVSKKNDQDDDDFSLSDEDPLQKLKPQSPPNNKVIRKNNEPTNFQQNNNKILSPFANLDASALRKDHENRMNRQLQQQQQQQQQEQKQKQETKHNNNNEENTNATISFEENNGKNTENHHDQHQQLFSPESGDSASASKNNESSAKHEPKKLEEKPAEKESGCCSCIIQ